MYVEIFPSKINVYPGKRQRWYVRLKGANHETMSTSQGYVRRWNAKRAARKMFPTLPFKFVDDE